MKKNNTSDHNYGAKDYFHPQEVPTTAAENVISALESFFFLAAAIVCHSAVGIATADGAEDFPEVLHRVHVSIAANHNDTSLFFSKF